ncbi:MAG: hypothetical protein ACYC2G_09505 [Gemmatimonadaceae bacterium]
MRRVLLALALLLMHAVPAGAQLAELRPGTRVRIRAPSAVAGPLEGAVILRTPDTVAVTRPDAAPISVPIAAITSADVSRGRSRSAGAVRGALWGIGVALLLGVATALVPDDRSGDCGDEPTDVGLLVGMPIAGLLVRAPIGALIGAGRWERIAIPVRTTVGPGGGRRVRLALSPVF